MNSKKRLLLVGAGRIAQVHAASVAKLPNAYLAGIADPNEEAGKTMADPVTVHGSRTFILLLLLHNSMALSLPLPPDCMLTSSKIVFARAYRFSVRSLLICQSIGSINAFVP